MHVCMNICIERDSRLAKFSPNWMYAASPRVPDFGNVVTCQKAQNVHGYSVESERRNACSGPHVVP